MLTTSWLEIIITSSGFLILLVYHAHLIHQVRQAPLKTSLGLTNRLRRDWVQTVMEERRDILAVQTLRNWVMASSFLASAAILIGLGVLNAAFRTDRISEITSALNFFGTKNETLWMIKLLALSVVFFFAFFNFALSIRYYNHASFAINVPPAQDPIVTYDAVAKIINHGTTHYTLGMRSYYLAVPFTLWLFGPSWMLAGAIVLILILFKLDRTV
jgi:uncharacterized membrane protein